MGFYFVNDKLCIFLNVVHFRAEQRKLRQYKVYYGTNVIDYVCKYKYLGVVFTNIWILLNVRIISQIL